MKGESTMKILNIFGKKMNAAAVMQLLAIIAVLSGSLFSASPCLAANNALTFDGTDDYVITATPVTTATDNVTMEAWVKWGGSPGSNQIVVYNGNSGPDGYGIMVLNSPQGITILCGGVGFANSSVDFTINTWEHVAAVRRAGTWELYINGVQKSLVGNPGANTPTTSTIIGSGSSPQCFNGQIDEVRIWNVARTQAQIQASMNYPLTGTEFNLVAHYNFDQSSGTNLPDLAGGDNNGTLTNMTGSEWTASGAPVPVTPPGNGLSFDGSNDYVQISGFPYIQVGPGYNATFEVWLKNPGGMIFCKNQDWDSGDSYEFWLKTETSGTVTFCWKQSGCGTSSDSVTDGQWHHVAVVTAGGSGTFYVDGSPSGTFTVTANAQKNFPFLIGARHTDNSSTIGSFFSGEMDELRIWNTACTQAQIQSSMYNTLVGNESGLVAYYNFDQTSGSTLSDMTANHYNGTVNGTEAWTAANWNYGYPYVSTGAVSSITDTAASVAGTLVDAGTSSVISSGICYGTSAKPTTPCTTGGFPASLAGLTRGAAYYARAYATNSAGTSYGSDVMFMTAPGNALSFNGSNQVNVPYNAALNPSTFTIEAWAKPEVLPPSGVWVSAVIGNRYDGGGGARYGVILSLDWTGKWSIVIGNGEWQQVTSSSNVVLSQWTHIAATYDGANLKLYINGVLEGTPPATGGFVPNPSSQFSIGNYNDGSSYYFNGKIDEVRLWNVARSQADIQTNMNKTLTPASEPALVAYYNFDQISPATALPDLAGGDNNGTLVNSPAWTPAAWNYGYPYMTTGTAAATGVTTASVAGSFVDTGMSAVTGSGVCWNTSPNPTTANSKTTDGALSGSLTASLTGLSGGVTYYARAYSTNSAGTGYGNEVTFTTPMNPPGNALNFDGTDDYVDCGDTPFQIPTGTWEAWFNLSNYNATDEQPIVSKDGPGFNDDGVIAVAADPYNDIVFRINRNSDSSNQEVFSDSAVSLNTWTHVAATWGAGGMKMYVNGVLQSTGYDSGDTNTSGILATGINFLIGKRVGSTTTYFKGQIDEVRIWNAARTQDEIRADMNRNLAGSEANLVAYYNFDRTSGTALPDLASLGGYNDGTLMNSPTWTDSSAFNVWTGTSDTNWNTAGNWSDGIPAASSNIYIPVVTNQPAVSGAASCNHFVIAPSATLTLSSGTLNVTGNIFSSGTVSGAGALVCSGTSAQTVKSASFENFTVSNTTGIILDGNLTINGALTMTAGSITPGTYTVAYGSGGSLIYNGGSAQTSTDIEFPASSGPANLTVNNISGVTLHADRTVSGTLTLTSGELSIGAHILTLDGGISGTSGTLTGGDTSDLVLGGTGNVTLPANALTLNNLTLNRSGAVVTLGNDLTVKGTLTLTAGILKPAGYNLILDQNAAVAGTTSASNMIVPDGTGEVRKMFADAAASPALPVSFTFPVGSDSGTAEYSPVTLNFTWGAFASAYIGVKLKDSQYPVNNSPADWLERYWTLTQSGITAFSCNVAFAYPSADIHGTESNIYGRLYSGTLWTKLNPAAGNQFGGTVGVFGDFTGADHPPVLVSPLADVTIYEDSSPTSISLSSVFSDFDDSNAAIAKSVVSDSNPGLVSAAVSGDTLALSYTPNGSGSAVIVIRGTANGKYAEDSFTVTVIPVDDAPVVSQKIPDVTVNEDAAPTVISLANVFADIDSVSIAKSLVSDSNPAVVTAVVEGDTLTLTYLKDQNGTADIVVRGTADGQYADTAFKVTVNAVDDPPVWISEIDDISAYAKIV